MRAVAVLGIPLLGLILLMPAAKAAPTLFDQLGGSPGVTTVVEHLVALVTTDARTKDDFDNINLDRLKRRLRDFLCQVADGPCHYTGRSMAATHEGLDITEAKFNAVAENLQTAMQQAGIPYWTQNRLMARLAPLAHDIVRR